MTTTGFGTNVQLLRSAGGTLPPPPEDPGDVNRPEDNPFERWFELLNEINDRLKDVPGFIGASSGRVQKERVQKEGEPRSGLGLVVETRDRDEAELGEIKQKVNEILLSYTVESLPVAYLNRDTIEDSVYYEDSLKRIEADLETLDSDPFLKENIVLVQKRKHPGAGFFLIVADDLPESTRADLNSTLNRKLKSPFQVYNKSIYDNY